MSFLARQADNISWGGLVLFCAFSPWSIALAETGLFLAIGGQILRWIDLRKIEWRPTAVGRAVVVFLAVTIGTALLGVNPQRSLFSLNHLFPLTIFFVLVNLRSHERRIDQAISVLAVSVALATGYGFVQHFSGVDWIHHRALSPTRLWFRSVGTFSMELTYAEYLALATVFLLVVGTYEKDRIRQIGLLITSQMAWAGVLFSYVRNAPIGVVGALIPYILFGPAGKKTKVLLLVLVTGGICYLLSPDLFDRYIQIKKTGLEESPANSRWFIWKTTIAIAKDHPLTGIGLDNYYFMYDRYRADRSGVIMPHAHNDWLHMLVSTGIVGFFAFVSLWGVLLKQFQRTLTRNSPEETSPANQKMFAWLGVMILTAYFCMSQFECLFLDEEVILLLFFLLGLSVRQSSGQKSQGSHTLTI